MADTVSLAAIAGIFHQPHYGGLGGKGSNDLCRVVTGTIVYDYDFCVPVFSMNVAENFLEAGSEARALIVGRDHDTVFRRQKVLSSRLSVGPSAMGCVSCITQVCSKPAIQKITFVSWLNDYFSSFAQGPEPAPLEPYRLKVAKKGVWRRML